jgi:hypothetical protein
MSQLARALSGQLGRSVLDKTGLTGTFDFSLKWTPDDNQRDFLSGNPLAAGVGDQRGPSIFTAVQEQLGPKLEAQKGSIDILAIDHVERPSFLGLVRLWILYQQRTWQWVGATPYQTNVARAPTQPKQKNSGERFSWLDWLDLLDIFDDFVVIALLIAGAISIFFVIWHVINFVAVAFSLSYW